MANNYDAIVIGSGISGGWAAKELTERGLNTLLLDRGRNVDHIIDYTTANLNPWDFQHGLINTEEDKLINPIQSTVYNEGNKHFFVSDHEHPYIQSTPFHWIRGYQIGGRSLTWGRQTYRLSDLDFEANIRDGISVDWPIRYKDISPWYDHVERFIGVSGQKEGISHLPDGEFLPAMELNALESQFKEDFKKSFPDRLVTAARVANLTIGWKDRGPCQYRNLCSRGCPFGGYFSSNSATIPAAMATGKLTIRPFSIVSEILLNTKTHRAKGVKIIDTETKETIEFYSKIIFLNASTIATAAILLNSTSNEFPNGLGNSSGQVGHNLMDHHFRIGAQGEFEGLNNQYYKGRKPGGIYIPRFRNLNKDTKQKEYIRGFGIQGNAERRIWSDRVEDIPGFGVSFKGKISQPGPWSLWLGGWGETLPNYDNSVTLSDTKFDKWGIPLVKIRFEFGENEFAMRKDMLSSILDILQKTGFRNILSFDYHSIGGDCVHEMGTARMGSDPKTSVLNKWNQMHDIKNIFITDGSCMTSSACQNPSLTYMALTARACEFAFSEVKKGNL